MSHLTNKIRAIRALKNLTQENVSETLGMSQSAYGKIERGETKVTWEKLCEIATVLQINIWDIVHFNTHEAKEKMRTGPDLGQAKYIPEATVPADMIVLQAKVDHLEKLNKVLLTQLADKEEIIALLKEGNAQ